MSEKRLFGAARDAPAANAGAASPPAQKSICAEKAASRSEITSAASDFGLLKKNGGRFRNNSSQSSVYDKLSPSRRYILASGVLGMYESGTVIYADILFLVNFCMDTVCLLLAGRLCGQRMRFARIFLGAALGGAYGFVPYIADMNAATSVLSGLAAEAIICFAAFGIDSAKRFAFTVAAFIGSCALTGGLITALYGIAARGGGKGMFSAVSPISFVLICIASAAAAAVYFFACRIKLKTTSAEVRFSAGGKTMRVSLLADSGNLLTEPFSALPVIIVSAAALPLPFDDPLCEGFPLPVRVIPFSTGAGGDCLIGFLPESAEIVRLGKKPRRINAYIGVDRGETNYSGYDGLLPASLL